MTARQVTDVAASVRQRLLNHARSQGQDFQIVLTHYAIERLLYRLEHSQYSDRFVLKGAMLFTVWEGPNARQTRDLDLLGFGDPEEMAAVFRDFANQEVTPDDGLAFDSGSVRVGPIRDQAEYRGQRVRLQATLAAARIPLQIDVGFGDVVTPAPVLTEYPPLLDHPAPTVRMYPRETVVAEKFQAVVSLSTANTRVKDYYDLWHLAKTYEFNGDVLRDAVHRTFTRRATELPASVPPGLSVEYLQDTARVRQWTALSNRTEGAPVVSFDNAGGLIRDFVLPVTKSDFTGVWRPGGPWRGSTRG